MEKTSTNRLLIKNETGHSFNFKNYGGLRMQGWKKQSLPGMPLVSIVTIVRNDVAHLEKTILSILNQTYSNVEYVVIDGGSTDGTLEIIKKYEQYIDFWVSEPDKGTHDAINKGISLVTGDWVNIMHCGDYFYNNNVFEDVFLKNSIHGDIVYGDFIGIVGDTERAIFHSDSNTDRFWQGMVFGHQAVFTKTKLLHDFPFDTSYRVSSDYDFFMRCLLAGVSFQKVDVIIFVVGTLGISNNHWLKARLENWRIARRFKGNKLRTDIFHLRGIIYDVVFRKIKVFLSTIGLYEPLKNLYRKTLKKALTKNSSMERI